MNAAEPEGSRLEIGLLGPVEATIGGRPLPLGRRKVRALLALLAINANRVVSIDHLIEELWGERPPPTASVALYGLVSSLRKALEPEFGGALVTRAPGYMLELPVEHTDLGRFDLLARDGRRALAEGDVETASERLVDALALWRGPALQDVMFLPFAQREVDRLEESRLAVLEARIDADLARGRDGDLVPELESLVGDHPLRERLRGQLMVALYRDGRHADALAEYQGARTALDALGLEPSDPLRTLERAILRHDPSLSHSTPDAFAEHGDAGGTRAKSVRGVPGGRMLVVPLVALAAAAATVTVFALTSSGGRGAAHVVANGVAAYDDGKLVAAGSVAASPTEIAAGDGSLWVTSTDEQTVSRVDPDTGNVLQTIPVGSGSSGIAADDHGVWAANSIAGNVSRIDPRTNAVVQTIPLGGAPIAVALGPGSVWIANRDSQTISRLDSRTGDRTARIPIGAAPRALVFGAGSLWVADELRGVVFRFDPSRRQVVDTITVGNGPVDVTYGHGSVWVANSLDGTVSRIDPGRGAIEATIPVGDGPRGLAVDRDGVWVSNEFDGTLEWIDAHANVVRRVLHTGERPQGLAAADGRLFVAVRSAGFTHRGGTLRLIGTPPQRPNSVDTLNLYVGPTTLLTNDGLVGFRRVGGADGSQLVPDLAIAIPRPTDGGRTYTFHLRSGIRYSNGSLVRPEDARRALERGFIILPPQFYVAYYGGIVGSEACRPGGSRCDLSRGIVTDDAAHTVTFHLRRPDPSFLMKLALPIAFLVPADTAAKEATKRPLPATGPYMIDNFEPSRSTTLVRNPRFREWSKAAQPDGYPDRIVITAAKSPAESARSVERGANDYSLDGVPTELEHEVRTQYASQVRVNPVSGSTYLFLDTRAPPFDDIRVRRALNYAADRAAAVRVSTRIAGGAPTCQILPPEFPGFRRYCPYTIHPDSSGRWSAPDFARARRLVAASGTRGARVNVWVPGNHSGEGPFIAKLLRSLGYRAHLQPVDSAVYIGLSANRRRSAQAGLISWFADFPTASNFFDTFFACSSTGNWAEFCDRRIDAQIRRAIALQTTDPYLANQRWAQIDRAIVDQAPFVPLVALKEIDILSRRTGNYQFNPQWGVFLDQLWVR
jgi:peptide/nickel transport system substrate-binding protein